MNIQKKLSVAALFVVLVAGVAEAKGKPSGGGGTPTNYGCSTLKAGTVLRTVDYTKQKTLLMATYACYLCNMTTRVCAIQSPTTLVGWTFILP